MKRYVQANNTQCYPVAPVYSGHATTGLEELAAEYTCTCRITKNTTVLTGRGLMLILMAYLQKRN